MKLPEYAPSASDRASTREELFEVLELLGGFEETPEPEWGQGGDLLAPLEADQTADLLTCLDADHTGSPTDILDEICSEERLLMEIEPFNSLLSRKAQRIN